MTVRARNCWKAAVHSRCPACASGTRGIRTSGSMNPRISCATWRTALPPEAGTRSRRGRRSIGLAVLVLFVLGVLWLQHQMRDDPATLISGDELEARMASDTPPLILDVRTLPEYQTGHIPGAYYLDYRLLGDRIPALREVAPR